MKLWRAAMIGAALTAGVLAWRLRPEAHRQQQSTPLAREPRPVSWLASWAPDQPTSLVGRVACYVWAGPLTAAGVLLGVLSGSTPTVRDGVLVFAEARGIGGRMLRWRGFAAATLGHTVIAAHRPSAALMRHELIHVRQAERWGPLFVPLYLAGLVRYGYRRNPFERAAFAAAASPRRDQPLSPA